MMHGYILTDYTYVYYYCIVFFTTAMMIKTKSIKRFRYIFMCIILVDLVILLYDILTYKFIDSPKCFVDHSSYHLNYEQLEDVLLSKEQPTPGTSIFFIDSRCTVSKQSLISSINHMIFPQAVNLANLTARQACAVESAALHHPTSTVFVLFTTTSYLDRKKSTNTSVIDALISYPNVRLRNLNLWSYTNNTPVQEWILEGAIFQSSHIVEHVSDLLRLITLWRWGGLYLDLDTITLRNMDNLPPNYIGIEPRFEYLGNSVLKFPPHGTAHNVLTLFMQEFISNYNGSEWGYNGPLAITRVMSELCGTNETMLMMNNPNRCSDINMLHPKTFFAVIWHKWEDFFVSEKLSKVMKTLELSYLTHMWNYFSKNNFTKIGSNSALDVLAKKHCPRVYNIYGQNNVYL